MFHSDTQRLIDYWRSLKGAAAIPARADFDPAAVAKLLPRVFVADRTGLTFRLAGEGLIDLFGRSLRGTALTALFAPESRAAVRDAAAAAFRDGDPAVMFLSGETESGDRRGFEAVLAPLTAPDGSPSRVVGLIRPVGTERGAAGDPVRVLTAELTVYAAPEGPRAARLRLAALDGRRIA